MPELRKRKRVDYTDTDSEEKTIKVQTQDHDSSEVVSFPGSCEVLVGNGIGARGKFDRFLTTPRVVETRPLDPSQPADINKIKQLIRDEGWAHVKIMNEQSADELVFRFNQQYRELIDSKHTKTLLREQDMTLDDVSVTNIPMSVYLGSMGSGKISGNRLPHCHAHWEARKVLLKALQPLYGSRLICPMQFALTNGEKQHTTHIERNPHDYKPRGLFHFDYHGPFYKQSHLTLPGSQAIMLLTDPPQPSDPISGTVVFPRSHKIYGELQEINKRADMLIDFVKQGKCGSPILPKVHKGCAILWSLQLLHSPHGHYGPRLSLPIAPLPLDIVPLKHRIAVAVTVLTGNPTGGYQTDTHPRSHPLYTRDKAQLKGQSKYVPLWGVSSKYFQRLEKEGVHPNKILSSQIKQWFTPLEVCDMIISKDIKQTIGIDFTPTERQLVSTFSW